jgi:hypothetical protein
VATYSIYSCLSSGLEGFFCALSYLQWVLSCALRKMKFDAPFHFSYGRFFHTCTPDKAACSHSSQQLRSVEKNLLMCVWLPRVLLYFLEPAFNDSL